MTTPVEANSLLLKSAAAAGYTINNSLRFRSSASAYLSRTPASASNRKTWTWSAWVKRGTLGVSQYLFAGGTGGTDTTQNGLNFQADDTLRWTGTATVYRVTSQVFRDPSAWYHFVLAFDTTQATANDRIKFFVNGVQVTTFSTTVNPTQNLDYAVNQAAEHDLARWTGATNYFDGYMAEVNFIDGQALTPASFGAYSTNGVWQPARYTGTYGTNGFYLKFASFGTTAALGTDSSGNGNTWTVNNFSVTAGTTYDPMLDSPTLVSPTVANYATLNPLQNGGGTASGGNLNMLGASGTWGSRVSTIAPTSGKWYFEITPTSGSATNGVQFGITKNATPTSYLGADSNGYSYYGFTGNKFNNGTSTAYGATVADNDVVGVAFDADAGSLTFYKNGTSQGVAFSGLTVGTWYLGVSCYNTATASINFGQRPFSYTAPSGYVALNAYNLPTPTITNGATVMAASLYTGTGTTVNVTNTINGVSFLPDLVWSKARSSAISNGLFDSNRGLSKGLFSNATNAEFNYGTGSTSEVYALNANGFSVGSYGNYNASGVTYVGWQWQAGQGSTSSNTAGTITSTVSVNATAGFSVVTYTGTGANATVGHGLGVAPSMVIIKQRTALPSAQNWLVGHTSLGWTNYMWLDLTNGTQTSSVVFNNTAPTSSVFSIGTGNGVNYSTATYVAYCWAAVAGYSAFGSYTGNGSADGPFVYTGFRPRWIMIKRTDGISDWSLRDTSRDTYNTATAGLFADLANAESTQAAIDILSNGFKCRDAGGGATNASGGTYIYAAFAENPFKYALAR